MLAIFDNLRDVTFGTVLFRLLLALVCGGVIGLERSWKNRPAGFRTHILICVGATVASVTGLFLYLNLQLPADISRIGAQVVSGLGFIGGGTIIVTKKQTIKGLTTAAGLWASGIIGLALGAGFFEGALVATVLVLFAETYFFRVSQGIKGSAVFELEVRYDHKPALDEVMRYCKDKRLAIHNLRMTGRAEGENAVYTAVLTLRARSKVHEDDENRVLERARQTEGVLSARILRTEE